MKKIFVLTLTIILAISTILPSVSQAEVGTKVKQPTVSGKVISKQNIKLDKEIISIADKYISIKNNNFKITNYKKLKEQITKENLHLVKKQLHEVNKMIKSYEKVEKKDNDTLQFKMTDRELKAKVEKSGYEYDLNVGNDGIQLFSHNNGINKVDWHWWGAEIWLSKTTVANIINGGITGGTAILGWLIPGLGHALLIAAQGFIVGLFVSENARAIKFNISWNTYIWGFEYQ
ncbi:hypothetical protein [Radiobacillus deserti]|uniref:Uncharacterized protein n=1 Tax=Radiobacillus deserti TaxID=2594883 RepID=A0A516KJK3_9BACI|nr:hypothetical protein [Radiobacillus deserti]QDP41561.1 hypothetical protein FN924_16100 [Radiobacillus deserti]